MVYREALPRPAPARHRPRRRPDAAGARARGERGPAHSARAGPPGASAGQSYNVVDEHCPTLRQWIEIIGDALGHTPALVNLPLALAAPACNPYLRAATSHHTLLGGGKAAAELGYRDAVPMRDAVAEYARWLRDNPPTRGQVAQLQDPFDYAAEDEIVAAWRAGDVAALRAVRWRGRVPGYTAAHYGAARNPWRDESEETRDGRRRRGAAGGGRAAPARPGDG